MDKKTTKHIINALRRATVTWSGRSEVLKRCRKKVWEGRRHRKTKEKIYKYHYQCEKCEQWYRDQSNIEVDHIVEIGPFEGNWGKFIKKMFCSLKNLQALCIKCHEIKTSKFNASLRSLRKRKDFEEEEFAN